MTAFLLRSEINIDLAHKIADDSAKRYFLRIIRIEFIRNFRSSNHEEKATIERAPNLPVQGLEDELRKLNPMTGQ